MLNKYNLIQLSIDKMIENNKGDQQYIKNVLFLLEQTRNKIFDNYYNTKDNIDILNENIEYIKKTLLLDKII